MKLVYKAYKYRIYPTKEQATLINKTIGCCRFIFNFFLSEQMKKDKYWYIVQEMVQSGQLPSNEWKGAYFSPNTSKTDIPKLKKNYAWLKEVDSISLQAAIEQVGDAYKRFYKKQNGKPKFKSKKNPVQSYTTKSVSGNIAIFDTKIQLPKLGLIRFANSRKCEGTIKNATIRRSASSKYFISILTYTEIKEYPKTSTEVGIDIGLKEFAVLSNGETIANPRIFQSLEEKLAKAQRKFSRQLQGSTNWNKQRMKVARIHEKIANKRKDFLDKLSTRIVKNHDVIAIEKLQIEKLLKEKTRSKSISDASWRKFHYMLEYKAEWYGKTLIKVGKMFPSSQLCSTCGYKNTKVKDLSIRVWTCPSCNVHHDRDKNASINILTEGKELLTI